MSEPTGEEMLEFLNSVTARWGGMILSEMRLYQAIRTLIKQKPKKSKEWFNTRLGYMGNIMNEQHAEEFLTGILTELGVEVSDE